MILASLVNALDALSVWPYATVLIHESSYKVPWAVRIVGNGSTSKKVGKH